MPLTLYKKFAWQTFALLGLFTCLVYVSPYCVPIATLRASKHTISITLLGPSQNKKNRTPKKTLKRCYTRRFATTTFSATQRCNIVGTLFLAVATLCCAKNRSYESSRVTSPLNRTPSCFSLWQQLRLLDNHYHWRYLEYMIQYFTVPRTDKPVVLQVSQLTEDTSDRIGLWKCWVLRRGEIWSTRRKRLGAREKPYNKVKLHDCTTQRRCQDSGTQPHW